MSDEQFAELPEVEIVEGEIIEESNGEGAEPSPTLEDFGVEPSDDPAETIRSLVEIAASERSAAVGYLDDLKRVAAEYDNFRKRALRDRDSLIKGASERVVNAMLPVLDSFDAALSIEAASETEAKMLGGMRSTYDLLLSALGKEGLVAIDSLGQQFDPEIHEAVMSSGDGELVVSQELRRGYRLGDRVLRPALVALESS